MKGKYLILPPGYDGQIPDGYFVFHSSTYTTFVILRGRSVQLHCICHYGHELSQVVHSRQSRAHEPGFLKDGKPHFSAALWRDGLKIYPLKSESNPPKMEFVDVSGKTMLLG